MLPTPTILAPLLTSVPRPPPAARRLRGARPLPPFLVGDIGSLLFQQAGFWSSYLSKWIPARLKKQACLGCFFFVCVFCWLGFFSCFFCCCCSIFWLLFFEMRGRKMRRERDFSISAPALVPRGLRAIGNGVWGEEVGPSGTHHPLLAFPSCCALSSLHYP